jgi:hypothetical protein
MGDSVLGLIDVAPANSYYDFCSCYSFQEKLESSNHRAFHRLCSLMRKMKAKKAIAELLPSDHQEIKEECDALNIATEGDIEIKAYRLTFLSVEIDSLGLIEKLPDDAFLSSTIIINFKDKNKHWKSYLYKAIVVIPQILGHPKFGDIPLLNSYFHVSTSFNCEVCDPKGKIKKEFHITGTYFTQQNSTTSVCAHASLSMAVNNSGLCMEWLSTEKVNKFLGIDHVTRSIRQNDNQISGLSPGEIYQVLEIMGLNASFFDFFDEPMRDYNQVIYPYVESGYPSLLLFTTDCVNDLHVVTTVGHTMNSDIWRSEAEPAYAYTMDRMYYKPASKWVDNFVIHDDNFGMYLNLPIDTLRKTTFPKYDPIFRARYAFFLLPAGVTTSPLEAEHAASVLSEGVLKYRERLGPLDTWCRRLLDYPQNRVIRTFLLTKDEYCVNLKFSDFGGQCFSDPDKKVLAVDLPERFWLSEITTIDLYTANKTKIIDFIYRCDCPEFKDSNDVINRWVQIRFPTVLIKRMTDGNLSMTKMSVNSHYKLLKLESQTNTLDW